MKVPELWSKVQWFCTNFAPALSDKASPNAVRWFCPPSAPCYILLQSGKEKGYGSTTFFFKPWTHWLPSGSLRVIYFCSLEPPTSWPQCPRHCVLGPVFRSQCFAPPLAWKRERKTLMMTTAEKSSYSSALLGIFRYYLATLSCFCKSR